MRLNLRQRVAIGLCAVTALTVPSPPSDAAGIIRQTNAPVSVARCDFTVQRRRISKGRVRYDASWHVVIRNRMSGRLADAVIALFALNGTGDIVGGATFEIPGPSARPIGAGSVAPPMTGRSVLDTYVGSEEAAQMDSVERYVCGVLRVIPVSGAMWDDDSVRLREVAAPPLPFAYSGETVTTRTVSADDILSPKSAAPRSPKRVAPTLHPRAISAPAVAAQPKSSPDPAPDPAVCALNQTADTVEVNLQRVTLLLEIEDTEYAQARGLSGRASLAEHCGAVFAYREDGRRSLWMKNVNFSLDFVFVRRNGTITLIRTLPASPAGTPDSAIPTVSGIAADVIVIPGGEAARDGMFVGAEISGLP
jgi:uncharacterized membrane protein (UPF0127 family)